LTGGASLERRRGAWRSTALAAALLACGLAWVPGARAQQADTAARRADTTAAGVPRYRLDALVVSAAGRTGSRAADTRDVEILDRTELRSIPARTVSDLLRWAAGVDLRPKSPAQTDVTLRGSSFEQVLVLVDGVPVNDPQTGHFDLDVAVPLASVERVEILRGPASAAFGADAMGGVIDIVTRGADTPGRVRPPSVRASAGSFGTVDASAAGDARVGPAVLHAAAGGLRSDGHRDDTDYRIGLGSLTAAAPLGGGELLGSFRYARRDYGAGGFYGPYPAYERTRTLVATLAWRGAAGAGTRVEPRLELRRHHDDFELLRQDPAFYRNLHAVWDLGGGLTVRRRLGGGIVAAAGGNVHDVLLRSSALGRRDEGRGALFGEVTAGTPGAAVASAGLRQDWHQAYGGFLAPSLSAAVWPVRALSLHGAVGRSFRAPTFTERYYRDPVDVGNPNLRPERAWSAELGVRLEPAAGVRLDLTGFRRWARDLIAWARPAGAGQDVPWETRNVARADYRGAELTATALDVAGGSVRASFELLGVDPGVGSFQTKYALRPLEEKLALTAARPLPGGVRAVAHLLRARRRGDPDPFWRLDVRLDRRVSVGSLFLDLTNLTDDRHPDIVGQPVAGRAIEAGLTIGPAGPAGP
jgi:iron complex outermembrane receptor protein